jgi:hypothetical protein
MEHREPAPLGEGRDVRRGPLPCAQGRRGPSHGGLAESGDRPSPARRGKEHRCGGALLPAPRPGSSAPSWAVIRLLRRGISGGWWAGLVALRSKRGLLGVAGRGLGEAAGRALPQWRAKPAHQYRRAERGPLSAQSLSKNCSGSLRPLFLWGRRTLPHAGRDTRPPPPRRLMGAGRLR